MFRLVIITPNGCFLDEQVKKITVKTIDGYLGILPRHLPLVSSLEISVMKIEFKKENKLYTIDGGILYVDKEMNRIITPAIEAVEKIDLAKAQLELEIAKKALENNDSQLTQTAVLIANNKVKAASGEIFLKVESN